MRKSFVFTLLGTVFFAGNGFAFETSAKHALLMEAQTGYIMFEKDADVPMPPASMSKLMTIYIVFEALKEGRVSLDDEFVVSEKAWRRGGASSGGSTMFLEPGAKVKVSDLIRGIAIQSGNDACITVAENLAGTEGAFVSLMNEKAKELGLENSKFTNSTGLPSPNHRMSAKDLAKLARALINEFPEYYGIFSEKEFTYNGIKQGNRNPLLYSVVGADGLKTGHTSEAGYGLTGSVKTSDGRHLILVVNGLNSEKERSVEARNLANYGGAGFVRTQIASRDAVVATVPVWFGSVDVVDALVERDFYVTQARGKKLPTVKLVYDTPVKAPIKKGAVIGTLEINEGEKITKIDVVAAKDVQKAGYFKRVKQIISSWF